MSPHKTVRQLLELADAHLHREHVGPGPHRMAKRLERESVGLMRLALKVAILADDLALKGTVRDALASRLNRRGNGHLLGVPQEDRQGARQGCSIGHGSRFRRNSDGLKALPLQRRDEVARNRDVPTPLCGQATAPLTDLCVALNEAKVGHSVENDSRRARSIAAEDGKP